MGGSIFFLLMKPDRDLNGLPFPMHLIASSGAADLKQAREKLLRV